MTTRLLVSLTALCAVVPAQQSSDLDRGDTQLTQVQGVINSVGAPTFTDAGFGHVDVASPPNFVAAAGGNVATPRLCYALFPDLNGSQAVELRVRRSIDGGRTWDPPVTVYTVNTAGLENLDSGDKGTHIFAWGDEVYVTFHTNVLNVAQAGQTLWVVASQDQGLTWTAPLNVSTGWNRAVGNKDWDVDETQGAAGSRGLSLVWEADFEDPLNPGFPNGAPNNNENLYFARVQFVAGVLTVVVPETPLTAYAIGTADVDSPSIDAQDDVVLVGYVDDGHLGLAPGGNATLSRHSFDGGLTWSVETVHSGLTPGTFGLQWAQPRKPWALLDGPYAFLIQEDSRNDEDDVWMDRGDIDLVGGVVNWNVAGVQCNHTSTAPGSGDVDGIIAAAAGGVLAILYRDDSAGTPLDNSNEAYLVVDGVFGFEFQAGTNARHTVTTETAAIYDLEVAGNVVCGVYEGCNPTNEEGGVVLSHDRGQTIDAHFFTTLGGCNAGTTDIDDIQAALTRNGDFNIVYSDERLGASNANNVSWVTGGKYPRLAYDGAAFTLTLDHIDPLQSAGGTAFLMISGSTAVGTDLNAYTGVGTPGQGHFVGLDNDLLWGILWSNLGPYLVSISGSGTATWGGIPNVSALFGVPIHIAAGTLDFAAYPGDVFVSYSDPILQ